MIDAADEGSTSGRPDDRAASALRFGTEIVAWVATPWALAGRSWLLAVLSLVILIGLPTLFSTPGDKSNVIVAVPGWGDDPAGPAPARGGSHFLLAGLAGVGGRAGDADAVATVATEGRRWRWLVSAR